MGGISRDGVRGRSEEGRFERGLEYHREDKVRDRVRRGEDLEAEVEGSRQGPYMVEVSLSGEGDILGTACSCPDDYPGDCKHVVAILLDWVEDPDSFRRMESVESLLEERSREGLIALVREMLDREPHLKSLLESPLPGLSDESSEPVDMGPYRREVRGILEGYQGWGDEHELASSLSTVVKRGEDHLESGEFRHAAAVFRSVIGETLEVYGRTHDEGDILREVQGAIDGLTRCLDSGRVQEEFRWETVDLLWWVVEWDIDFGGIGLMERAWEGVLEGVGREERHGIREAVIEGLKELEAEDGSRWEKEQYGRLLLELDEDDGNADRFLEEAEEFGLHELRANVLLDLDRLDEAIEAGERIENPHDILEFASLLCEGNRERDARRIVADRSDDAHDEVKKWLAEFDEERGDIESALELEAQRFRSNPSQPLFRRTIELAEELGLRDEYRSELIGELKEEGRFDILAEIFLEEGKLDRAWNYASKIDDQGFLAPHHIKEEIVEAGEDSRPDRAVEFYLNEVRRLIEKRGRKNYRRAASYLERVKDVHLREGEGKEWRRLIAGLRDEFNHLPACQDEFDKAGL